VPSITGQPANQSVMSGQSATLTVDAAGTAPLLFQWYAGTSPDTAAPMAGATSSTFATPGLTSTTSYWVRVSNSVGSVSSDTATVTVLTPPPPPSPDPPPAPPPPTGSPSLEDEVLTLINQRRAAGATCGGTFYPAAAPLALNLPLRNAARGHSQDMAANNYLSHTSLDGRTYDQRIWQAGYTGGFPLAENIAGGPSSAQAVVDGWMQSAGHCRNIMGSGYRVVGIGYAFTPSSTYRHYWTQAFGGG
jgi:uncharacterized protein YkwD